jgi:hypothetical protein
VISAELFSVSLKDVDAAAGGVAVQEPSDAMREPNPRAFDLAIPGFPAELSHHFMDLSDARGTERMTLGEETTTRRHGHTTS